MSQKPLGGKCSAEAWEPLPLAAPDNFKNMIFFVLRLFLDFQVATVYPEIKKFLKNTKNNILEIGCGAQPYRHLIPKDVNYCALESLEHGKFGYQKNKDILYYDGKNFPFPDNRFSFIFHTEVLEHVYDLGPFLSECHRVLIPEGRMFFTIPFAVRYHYIPNDYWRFTPSCLEKLLQKAGFKNIVFVIRGSDITVTISKLTAIFYRIIFKKYRFFLAQLTIQLLFGILLILPILFLTFLGHLSLLFKLGSSDDPLGYSVHCVK